MDIQNSTSSRRSFQPAPVKSGDDANNHERRSPSFVLANSPHPVLDGLDARTIENRKNRGRTNDDDDDDEIPPGRSHYPSDSEFVGAGRAEDGATDHDARVEVEAADGDSVDRHNDRDDRGNSSDDDTDEGRGEEFREDAFEIPTLETYVPREPSYAKADALPFFEICRRLEALWKILVSKKRVSKKERLAYLLPDRLNAYLDGGSPFPFLRLVLSDHDSSRAHTGLKEAKIATAWATAMSLPKNGKYHNRLTQFRNANLLENKRSAGDLSCVVMDVANERMTGKGSKLTVGEVNEWLDVLVDVAKDGFGAPAVKNAAKSAWRRGLEKAVASDENAKKQDKYVVLVEKLIGKNFSPVEHKFIVRILMQHTHVGINLRDIMGHLNPHAMEIHNSFNSLNDTCTRLSDPEYRRLLKATVEKNTQDIMENNRNIWMTPSMLPAAIQKTISPMLSRRTGFDSFLKEVAHRHGVLDGALPAESPAKSCMALRHPAFLCDVKMDGERDLVHVRRGIVTVQTRNGTWYSPLYSPAVGPSIRAAIAGRDVDVVLDGEMIAWDAVEGRPAPFGSNRAAAEATRRRRARDGTLDGRDAGLHEDETDVNVMALARDERSDVPFGASKQSDGVPDDDCWLQYVVFDILYLDGPGAEDLVSESSHLFAKDEPIRTGSLINMDCMQRKSILYNLIRPQEKVVEHVRSVVVRPDGSVVEAADYFSGRCDPEYGRAPCELDSIYLALCDESGTTKFDRQRMRGNTHEDIEIQRSLALEQLYSQIVDLGGQEGLIFKDLASPYYLGAKSRSMGYWWKLKPDYDESGGASDIDLLVLGGRYARGFDRRGMVGSLVVGCLGDDYMGGEGEGARYMAVTKVNFNKNTEKVLRECTGYQRADEHGNAQMGKWFESEEVPDYLASRSYQRGPDGDEDGWRPQKSDRPDIWIRPEDSFVVTVNAGEIQTSGTMQAGFSLRFPRISKYRGKGTEDPKNPDEVAHWGELDRMLAEQEENRREEVIFGSRSQRRTSRFLTAKQLQTSGRRKAAKNSRKRTDEVKQFHVPDAGTRLSGALDGFLFSVQPGNYRLLSDAFAAAEAEENDWATDAASVGDRLDVIRYIQSHGGTCELAVHRGTDFLLGGAATDAKVSNLRTLMANTDANGTGKKDAEARRLLEMGGILKWAFVYSIVSKFLKNLDDDASGYDKSIKMDWPSLAHPRRSDFLVMSDAAQTTLHATEDEYGLHINETASSLDFARALEEVGRQKSTKKSDASVPWQSHAAKHFGDEESWIFGGKAQKLWPHGEHADADGSVCILYPDLFADLGLEEEGDADNDPRRKDATESRSLGNVAAALPLARALGAIVTPHLHGGVTHVLCDLKRHKTLEWSSMHTLSIFSDAEAGLRLRERLISLEESAALDTDSSNQSVLLVSPDWLEEKWNEV